MTTLKYILYSFACVLFIISCAQKKDHEATPERAENKKIGFVEEVENAHKKEKFLNNDVISFDLDLSFGGQPRLNGKFITKTNSQDAVIIYNTGDTLYINDDDVFASSLFKEQKSLRFDAYTWTYFFLLPYKLSDQGAMVDDLGLKNEHKKAKLTFGKDVGDAPDDWYMLHIDKQNNLLDYVAYIVTANKTKEEAEEDPHAIRYFAYEQIDGIQIASQWEFYEWSEGKELSKKIGEAQLKNISFAPVDETFFTPPKGYVSI